MRGAAGAIRGAGLLRAALVACALAIAAPPTPASTVDDGFAALDAGDYEGAVRAAGAAMVEARGADEIYAALDLAAEIAFLYDPPAEALPLAEEADARARALFGAIHEERLSTLERVAILAVDLGEGRRAVAAFAEMLRMGAALGLTPDRQTSERLNMAGALLEAGRLEAASVLASEVLMAARDMGAVYSEPFLTAALIRAEAQLGLGRPVEGLVALLDVLEGDLDAYLAAWPETAGHVETVFAAYDAAAAERGEVGAVTDDWLARADRVRRTRPPFPWEAVERELVTPFLAGDLATAEAAARRLLDGIPADAPEPAPVLEALVARNLAEGRPGGAAPWLMRLAAYPPGYLAARMEEPWLPAAPVIDWLRTAGRLDEAVALGATMIETARLAHGDAHADVLAMRLAQADALALAGEAEAARDEVAAVKAALDGLTAPPPSLSAWASFEEARLLREAGRTTEAFDRLNAARVAFEGAGLHPDALYLDILAQGAALARAEGRAEAAIALSRAHVAQVEAAHGAASRQAAIARLGLVGALEAAGDRAASREALAALRDALSPAPEPGDPLWGAIAVAEITSAPDAADIDATLAALFGGEGLASQPVALRLTFLSVLADRALGAGRVALAADLLGEAEAAAPDDPVLRLPLDVLAGRVALARGDAGAALARFRRASASALPGAATGHVSWHLEALQRVMNAAPPGEAVALMPEAFALAQRINATVAGEALSRAARRWQVGGDLAAALRDVQDTEAEAARLREALAAAPAPSSADRARLDAAVTRLAALEGELAARFPAFAAHGGAAPVPLDEVRALLGPDEALIVLASTDLETAGGAAVGQVTVVTREATIMEGLPARADLARIAEALRCEAALTDPRCAGAAAGATRGGFVLDPVAEPTRPGFDFALAHAAYGRLVAPLDEALAGKSQLIFVPDAATMPLPFHLMLTEAPKPGTTFATAPWLIRSHAVSVAPSVASFAALRRAAPRTERAPAFLGVGDPLIGAQAAGALPYPCGTGEEVLTALAPPGDVSRGAGTAEALRRLSALPDTRCELAEIAAGFGDAGTLLLQEAAHEGALKEMSATGALEAFSVIGFATHGLIAGEVGAADAGLVLTPPADATAPEDGLLTTAEIAGLRLDAEFVLLSACNTASGRAGDDEGLSGLASAFFHAGARSLLVSHWPVYSDAAVALTTRLFAELDADPRIGRAEAMRRAMLAQIDDPLADPRRRHPAYWAPFMLAGATR